MGTVALARDDAHAVLILDKNCTLGQKTPPELPAALTSLSPEEEETLLSDSSLELELPLVSRAKAVVALLLARRVGIWTASGDKRTKNVCVAFGDDMAEYVGKDKAALEQDLAIIQKEVENLKARPEVQLRTREGPVSWSSDQRVFIRVTGFKLLDNQLNSTTELIAAIKDTTADEAKVLAIFKDQLGVEIKFDEYKPCLWGAAKRALNKASEKIAGFAMSDVVFYLLSALLTSVLMYLTGALCGKLLPEGVTHVPATIIQTVLKALFGDNAQNWFGG